MLQSAYSPDPVMQSIVAKIILALAENVENRAEVLTCGAIDVLAYIQVNKFLMVWLYLNHGFILKVFHNAIRKSQKI